MNRPALTRDTKEDARPITPPPPRDRTSATQSCRRPLELRMARKAARRLNPAPDARRCERHEHATPCRMAWMNSLLCDCWCREFLHRSDRGNRQHGSTICFDVVSIFRHAFCLPCPCWSARLGQWALCRVGKIAACCPALLCLEWEFHRVEEVTIMASLNGSFSGYVTGFVLGASLCIAATGAHANKVDTLTGQVPGHLIGCDYTFKNGDPSIPCAQDFVAADGSVSFIKPNAPFDNIEYFDFTVDRPIAAFSIRSTC